MISKQQDQSEFVDPDDATHWHLLGEMGLIRRLHAHTTMLITDALLVVWLSHKRYVSEYQQQIHEVPWQRLFENSILGFFTLLMIPIALEVQRQRSFLERVRPQLNPPEPVPTLDISEVNSLETVLAE